MYETLPHTFQDIYHQLPEFSDIVFIYNQPEDNNNNNNNENSNTNNTNNIDQTISPSLIELQQLFSSQLKIKGNDKDNDNNNTKSSERKLYAHRIILATRATSFFKQLLFQGTID